MPGSTIETLGDLIDNHHRVSAWCPHFAGFRPLDMNKLIARLGRDWRYIGRRWPVVRSECGTRLMITIARRSARTGGAGGRSMIKGSLCSFDHLVGAGEERFLERSIPAREQS
jgi:hypothetical protein